MCTHGQHWKSVPHLFDQQVGNKAMVTVVLQADQQLVNLDVVCTINLFSCCVWYAAYEFKQDCIEIQMPLTLLIAYVGVFKYNLQQQKYAS